MILIEEGEGLSQIIKDLVAESSAERNAKAHYFSILGAVRQDLAQFLTRMQQRDPYLAPKEHLEDLIDWIDRKAKEVEGREWATSPFEDAHKSQET